MTSYKETYPSSASSAMLLILGARLGGIEAHALAPRYQDVTVFNGFFAHCVKRRLQMFSNVVNECGRLGVDYDQRVSQ